ncbi:hypothetical protein UY3_07840 [Chelonia mydas]|uniref:Uncharacterized protein n=1 Tax=Chelonia mydas TaxID=8469 RepID=M7BAM5_CHEMY|nr:hypothetical protein UY3_07840 [Chelonia mydas]
MTTGEERLVVKAAAETHGEGGSRPLEHVSSLVTCYRLAPRLPPSVYVALHGGGRQPHLAALPSWQRASMSWTIAS